MTEGADSMFERRNRGPFLKDLTSGKKEHSSPVIIPPIRSQMGQIDHWLEGSKTKDIHEALANPITPSVWRDWIDAALARKIGEYYGAKPSPQEVRQRRVKLLKLRHYVSEGLKEYEKYEQDHPQGGPFNMFRRMHFIDRNAARILSGILVLRTKGNEALLEEKERELLMSFELPQPAKKKGQIKTREEALEAHAAHHAQLGISTPDIVKTWLVNGLEPIAADKS